MSWINERDADIIAALLDQCDRINDILSRISNDKAICDSDVVYQDAIKMNLFQIGELVHRLSAEFRQRRRDIPWDKIYGTRNIIAHGYLKVDDDIIWETCVSDVPQVRRDIERLYEETI